MLRAFVLALILAAMPAVAETYDDGRVVALVRSQDIAGLDRFLSDAQAAFDQGDISADQMRALYVALSRSHYQTVRFVETWAAQSPENPRAQIARAWSLWHAADQVHEPGSDAAYVVFAGMRRAAVDHAMRAHAISPTLIPVSDAVLRMYMTDPAIGDPVAALDTVMETHPNWGSLLRVLPLVARFGRPAIDPFCDHYGAMVGSATAAKCKMYGYVYFTPGYQTDFAEWDAWDADDPDMVMYRIVGLTTKFPLADLSEEQVNWLEDSILTFDADLYQLLNLKSQALNFAGRVGVHHGRHMFYERFQAAHLARTTAFLDVDRYNLDLLDMVEGVAFAPEWEITDRGNQGYSAAALHPERTDAEQAAYDLAVQSQKLDFAGRRIMANPHNGYAWQSYAFAARGAFDSRHFFDVDGALVNAVVYASDPVDGLSAILLHKTHQDELFAYRGNEVVDKIWAAVGRDVDYTTEVLCPFLRAQRVRDGLCASTDRQRTCDEMPAHVQAGYDKLSVDARKAPECAAIREADLADLWYSPVPARDALVVKP